MNNSENGAVLETVAELTQLALGTYAYNPARIEEDANGERRIHQGGYGDRQLFELVQNAADELRDLDRSGGRIHVILTEEALYCANEGTPMTPQGADTILRMGVSKKRGGQIGRFGVGVKSVLSVTRTPQFFSTTGSFGFDADWSAKQILDAVNESRRSKGEAPLESIGETPVLRMARPLESARQRADDSVLDSLLGWASTVVRLPLVRGAADRLSADIHYDGARHALNREFPHLFQLFSSHVGTVVLEDRSVMPKVRREISCTQRGDLRTIHQARSGAKSTAESYRVFSMPHGVSDESRRGAGELHDRVTIDISWAVPEYSKAREGSYLTVPAERGTFWSHFPTKYPMQLSGALNAAWKTNEDRQNLLGGSELNAELLEVAANLVVGSLEELSPPEDPAAYLPLLPGRARDSESPNWACKFLTEHIWKLAAKNPSLPDQRGVLQIPTSLRIHSEKLSTKALGLWREYEGRPTDWVHHSIEGPGFRRGKMVHILDAASHNDPASIPEWLEALVADGTVDASKAAIRVLAHLLANDLDGSKTSAEAADARRARIVLTDRGEFVAPTAGGVFRRSSEDGLRDDLVYVDQRVADDDELAPLLDRLGIREADTEGRFHSVLDQGFARYTEESWSRFWELLHVAGGASQARAIADRVSDISTTLHARTIAGKFQPLHACMLPGPVVPGDGSRDADLTIDMEFHANDRSILREFGVADRPITGIKPEADGWFESYRASMYEMYCASLPATTRPVMLHTMRLEGGVTAGPLHLFKHLSPEGRAAFLAAAPEEGFVENWTRQIGKASSNRAQVISPIRWLFHTQGWVNTSQGLVRVQDAVGPQLDAYSEVLPVAHISAGKAQRLRLPSRVEEVASDRWKALLDSVKSSTDDAFVGRSYALLIRVAIDLLLEEDSVRCRVGDSWDLLPDESIAVAVSRVEYDELIRENHPALLVDSPKDAEQVEVMINDWGMRRVSDVIEKRIRSVASGEATALAAVYPALRQRLGSRVSGLMMQRCVELEEVVRTPNGTRLSVLPSALDESTVFVPDNASAEEALVLADQEFGFGLGPTGCRQVIEAHRRQLEDQAVRERISLVRTAKSIPDKLAAMLDETQLRQGLPAGLVESDVHENGIAPGSARLAELAYNAHDDGVLKAYAKEISSRIPGTPHRFDGGSSALKFVTDLGFPDSFAGARLPSLPEREIAHGPTNFPVLHPYQEEIATRFVDLLCKLTPQRAMLSLPTGAGKTRVAAEGVIRWIRKSGLPAGPVLWIAQTGELCEQAVQSWKFVWEKVGADYPLMIDRLWSGNSATPVTGRPHLVVATDAKLRERLGTDEYGWLRSPSLVIVDEAHEAISPEYTKILELLGLTHWMTSRHLVGLTATPFRNNADTTRRLVQRFGNSRLDEGVFEGEPIASLQKLQILSSVEHRELPGAEIALYKEELAEIEKLKNFLPKSAERRLAEDEGRNKILIDEIVSLPNDWPVLVFATSVDHAKLLAAKLSDRGIRSVAIDSATPIADRRRWIEGFRKREIRVITNYGVLSQGFDAPATRAVFIARPVYSANAYQQMVGRGLRGPKNGGKDTCLILDVRDNITNYDNNLAFTEFEHLWEKEAR
ncbi:sacsin N-terminal ATP-binding-like domain-containing protein [Rhodococcus sp. NCIMB 12038]|uniref:sacsin N-terminal ATP-binding-like domain-containing protein n=1 Tax=Rhodococcus sp. NCIMB 12038 TaxID=933800 RepID=UPI000B3D164F|nr:DEAD/DEAH box helicase family protein [Rhodococcus sp. NCIMB 12038]OUS94596.1 helicase [Rhodococcus sp. NCIMB 12038]